MSNDDDGPDAKGVEELDDSEYPEQVALNHALVRWEAETENATRLSNRENGMLTVIAAVLGFGLFKADDLRPSDPLLAYAAMLGCVLLSLSFLFIALYKLLCVPQRSKNADGGGDDEEPLVYASNNLAWPPSPALHPTKLRSSQAAYAISYKLVTRAANSLNARNLKRKDRVDTGQRFLFAAALAAGVSIVAYAFTDPSVATATGKEDNALRTGVDVTKEEPNAE